MGIPQILLSLSAAASLLKPSQRVRIRPSVEHTQAYASRLRWRDAHVIYVDGAYGVLITGSDRQSVDKVFVLSSAAASFGMWLPSSVLSRKNRMLAVSRIGFDPRVCHVS